MIRCSPKVKFLKSHRKIQGYFYDFIMNYKFDIVIQSCIVLNVIFMGLATFPVDIELNKFLEDANLVFVVIFGVEMTLKIIGLGYSYYFADSWNKFDCFVTCISIVAISPLQSIGNAAIFRSFRIARLFRLVKIYKGFQIVINKAILAGPSLMNIGGLLFLLFFIYSIAGMYLFGGLDYSSATTMTDQINFSTFYNSFILVFQCVTGEN